VLDIITGIDNCNVDETFHERIRDQSNIRTARTKPVELPLRYLLWIVAGVRKDPLYKVNLGDQSIGNRCIFEIVISPSRNRIAIDWGETIGVYDLKNKEKLTTLVHPELTFHGIRFLDDTRILSFSAEDIRLSIQGDGIGRNWTTRVLHSEQPQAAEVKEILDIFVLDQHTAVFATVTHQIRNDGSVISSRLVFNSLDVIIDQDLCRKLLLWTLMMMLLLQLMKHKLLVLSIKSGYFFVSTGEAKPVWESRGSMSTILKRRELIKFRVRLVITAQ